MSRLLILQHVSPLSLVDELRADPLFSEIIYKPHMPFGPTPNDVFPTPEELERAEVIFSFVAPKGVDSVEKTPNLKLFQGLSAGYSHVTDTAYFKSIPKESDLTFANASGIHVSTIGEHVICTTQMLLHRLHTITYRLRADKDWFRAEAAWGSYIRELRDLTVGIIGYGHIGRETARLAAGAGSRIIALNRAGAASPESGYIIPGTGDPDGSLPEKYYSTTVEEETLAFFSACDVVVNTLPDSKATRGFVGEKELRAMKGNAIFVNIGRGTTVVQDKLVEALKGVQAEGEEEGATGTLRIGGASLDVVDPEPLPADHELYSLENVVLTPHMSGLSRSYYIRAADLLKTNVRRLQEGKGALNCYRGKGE